MYKFFSNLKLPIITYDKPSSKVEYNDAFIDLFSKEHLDIAIVTSQKYMKDDIDNNNALPSTSHLLVNEVNFLCIHFSGNDDIIHFLILLPYSGENAFISVDKNGINDMLNCLQENVLSIMGALHNDLVLADKTGKIKVVLPSFEDFYGISPDKVFNKTVYDLEEEKVLQPSIIANVLRTGEEACMLQHTLTGRYLMCYGKPLYNSSGEIEHVISYSRDHTQYELIKAQYNYLNTVMKEYASSMFSDDDEDYICDDILGNSNEISTIKNTLRMYAKFDANVLLTGESGVGKTLYAKAIHNQSERRGNAFININCGAISENLFESEFFGYESGAFTGAHRNGKIGLVECADCGTLFLDEIADLPMPMQVKLLQLLDEKTITRVGGIKVIPVNFRLIVATNKDIPQLISEGKFREDLYFRLNLLSLEIPPLRCHPTDIPTLVKFFTERCLEKYGTVKMFSGKAVSALMDYPWAGNIRELKNLVERLCLITNDDLIDLKDIPEYIYKDFALSNNNEYHDMTLREILDSVEKDIILKAYKKHGSTTKVAEVLGISQPSASIKLKKYNTDK